MKTLLERLAEATTHDRQLEAEIYLGLYREDLLRKAGAGSSKIVNTAALMTTDKPKTWAAALGEHENRDGYPPYHLSIRAWVGREDGSAQSYHVPMFTYSFDSARELLPKEAAWSAGFDPTLTEKKFWCAINNQPAVHHANLTLAVALAAVQQRNDDLRYAEDVAPAGA